MPQRCLWTTSGGSKTYSGREQSQVSHAAPIIIEYSCTSLPIGGPRAKQHCPSFVPLVA